MDFVNLTPFSAMNYLMDDTMGRRYHVLAMKTGFRLESAENGRLQAVLQESPAAPLAITQEYCGEINSSLVKTESDLSPYKPRCDVIINGTAYTPGGVPAGKMRAGFILRSHQGDELLNKQLIIVGEYNFQHNGLTGKWQATEPEPFTSLPLDYRYAFGGECCVETGSSIAHLLPDAYQLTAAQRAEHPQTDNPPLAYRVCPLNPHGRGYSQTWFLRASGYPDVPAPRILSASHPFTLAHFTRVISDEADWSEPAFQPAGTGIIPANWQPRLALAGTFDDAWLTSRHPALPADFDFGYWNCAPQDQQIPFLQPGTEIELTGFHPDGNISFLLPPHQARVLLRMNAGELIPQLMWLDTLHIDTDTRMVSLTWRYLLPVSADVRVMEARYSAGEVLSWR